ncbi:MAG: ABC transporter ATP-binding protein [Candidatus Nomurabacteria bacterium]|nr:MAG: ABC transporter ATP-binding protein [Candidatus Nomurabacteria bacterium]
MSSPVVLDINNVTKFFGKQKALEDVSLKISKGEIFGFLGPNGAGKSTTIRCITDTIRPNKGSVTIFGKDANKEASSTELKNLIGYVPAEPNLYPNWTVDRHIKFAEHIFKVDSKRSTELKKLLSIDGDRKVGALSTGNHQKLAIILALIHNPMLLILDEPTRGLDPLFRSTLHQLLRDYQARGGTILLSSHDLYEVEELCSKVAIIKDGKIIDDTDLSKLKKVGSHSIKVTFKKSVPKELNSLHIEDLTTTINSASFLLRGDLNKLLEILVKYNVQQLSISSPTLEDIFKEIYS